MAPQDGLVQVAQDSTGKIIDNAQVPIAPATGLAAWQASTSYSKGAIVQPVNPGLSTQFICTTAGTSAASEPSWPTTAQGTVADNTAVWQEYSSRQRQRVVLCDASTQAATLGITNNPPPPMSYGMVAWIVSEQFEALRQIMEDVLVELKVHNYIGTQGLNVPDTEVDQFRADVAQDYQRDNQTK